MSRIRFPLSVILLAITVLVISVVISSLPTSVMQPAQASSPASAGWSSPLHYFFKSIDTLDDVNLWAAGSSGLIVFSGDGGTSWTLQNTPTEADLNSIDIVDTNLGWVVGNIGTILHTNNGGDTWTLQDAGIEESLYDVSFVDVQHGWAVGANSTIIRTSDGGVSWRPASSLPIGEANLYQSKIQFTDTVTGWVGPVWIPEMRQVLWATTDGGNTWHVQSVPTQETDSLNDFSFFDNKNGWALSANGVVFRTSDGGASWNLLTNLPQIEYYNNRFHSIAFDSTNEGWVVDSTWYPDGYYSVRRIFHSTDGGNNWTQTGTGTSTCDTIVAFPSGKLWDIGNCGSHPKWPDFRGPEIYNSTNEGQTWNYLFGLTKHVESGRAVDMVDSNTGYVLTRHRQVMITEDGGLLWKQLIELEDLPPISDPVRDITSLDATTAWIVGGEGLILKSTDRGLTWHEQSSGIDEHLFAVKFQTNLLGLAVGANGRIVRTTNGGITWISVESNTGVTLHDVDWVDAQSAVAVGYGGAIIRSTDAGVTWKTIAGITKQDLYGIDFAPESASGWAVGANRTILHTTDGGRSWRSQIAPVEEWVKLNTVSAVSHTEAHAGGRATIIDTFDAGDSWGVSYNSGYYITDIDFAGPSAGIATGDSWGDMILLRYVESGASPSVTVPSYHVDQSPEIDGDLSDWPPLEEVTLNEKNANTISKDHPSEYDLSTYARSMWTDSTLYFAIRTFDNRIVNDSANVWNDDQIELGIDGLHDGDPSGADDHQYTINADGRKTDRGVPTEGFQAVIRERIDGWDAEIAIPASHIQGGAFHPGKIMGFNWGMHDDDTGGSYDTHLIWKTDSTFGVKPGWAALELLDDASPPVNPPTVTPTPSGDTVTLQEGFLGYSGGEDASISQWYPDINYGGSYTLTVRGDSAIGTLLQYDLSTLPDDIAIKRATLSLYPQGRSNPQALDASVYPLLRGWSEAQATWQQASNGNTWQIAGADGVTDREGVASDHKIIDWLQSWASFDLTELVQRWVDGGLTNNGVVVKQIGGPAVGYDFTSRDVTHWQDTPYRPELIVSYWNAIPTVTPTSTPTPTITPTPTPPCLDAYEPDDAWQQAKLILVDGATQQHNFHQPGDVDYVKFGVAAGAEIALYTSNLAPGVDTTLTLYDSDGVTQLAYNDIDPLNPPASRIDWTAPASGTYFLKAAHFNPATGACDMTYELAVERTDLTPTPVSLYLPLMMK